MRLGVLAGFQVVGELVAGGNVGRVAQDGGQRRAW